MAPSPPASSLPNLALPDPAALLAIGLLLALVFAIALLGSGALARLLGRRGILDRPNERSSHSSPIPRGGGLAVVAALLAGWPLLLLWQGSVDAAPPGADGIWPAGVWPDGFWAVYGAAAVLALVSFADDILTLGAAPRLAAQLLAVALALLSLDGLGPVFQGLLPLWLDRLLAGLAWLWFINLYNFMDGIDGITGVETVGLGVGLALVFLLAGAVPTAGLALLTAAAAAGFLVWNWQPARIFLGDVGAVPLGFLLGWLLLLAAARGQWLAALVLPAYYWSDATITLVRRLLRGERVWRAHREHFYQRATQRGRSHAEVARRVAMTNAGLVAVCLFGLFGPAWIAIAAAAVLVGLLLLWMVRGRRPGSQGGRADGQPGGRPDSQRA